MNRSSSRLKDSASKNSTVKRKVANRKGNVVKHSPVKGKAANRKGSAVKTSTVKGKAVKTSTVKGKAANRKQDELHKTVTFKYIHTVQVSHVLLIPQNAHFGYVFLFSETC